MQSTTLSRIRQLNDQRIELLQDPVKNLVKLLILKLCDSMKCQILVTSTLRDMIEQAKLYADGRGSFEFMGVTYIQVRKFTVTDSKPGLSWHNYGVAFDLVPCILEDHLANPFLPDTRYLIAYEYPNWSAIGKIGKSLNLRWGGDFPKPDFPHFQLTNGLSIHEAFDEVTNHNKQLIMHEPGKGYEFKSK